MVNIFAVTLRYQTLLRLDCSGFVPLRSLVDSIRFLRVFPLKLPLIIAFPILHERHIDSLLGCYPSLGDTEDCSVYEVQKRTLHEAG
jgi:hypothetical protein